MNTQEVVDEETPKQRPALVHTKILPSRKSEGTVSIVAHEITCKGDMTACEVEDVIASINAEDDTAGADCVNAYWLDAELELDMTSSSKRTQELCFAELKNRVLDKLPLPPFLQRHLTFKQLCQPRFLALNNSALMVLRTCAPIRQSQHRMQSDEQMENCSRTAHFVTALCLPRFLLTINIVPFVVTSTHTAFRKLGMDSFAYVSERELPQASSTGALSVWLMYHLNQASDRSHSLRLRVFDLDDKIDRSVAEVTLDEIMDVKDTFLHIMAIAEEQKECIDSLLEGQKVTSAIDFKPFKGFRGLLSSTASSTERMLTRIEKRIMDIRQTYDAHQQDRINGRLATLTILSAVFLPLTLMAGVWGMNFTNMPELGKEHAYYYALASMATVAALSLSLFYFYGWL